LNQSEPSSLIVGSVHMSKSGVEETSVLWCFFNLFGVLIPIDELVTKGHLRPLKEASEAENVA
ncbi:hypothetical protein Q2V38_25720, partial [Escherichia coli]|nr:hypothetical protein [Escherichia coli]